MALVITTVFAFTATSGLLLARWIVSSYNNAPSSTNDIRNETKNEGNHKATTSQHTSSDKDEFKLTTEIPVYDGPNPFVAKALSNYEKFKIYIFCISGIVFIRMICTIILILILYCLSIPITVMYSSLNNRSNANQSIIHKLLVSSMKFVLGIALLVLGFHSISMDFEENEKKSNARVIVANHCTMFDGMILLYKTNGIVAAKKEISSVRIMGRIMNALGILWIDRHGKKGRSEAKQQIIDHVNNPNLPPLIIFPQGTTTSVYSITTFKTGAFIAGKSVLPIAIDWTQNVNCDLSFVDVNAAAHALYVSFCQFRNYCKIHVLTQHCPSSNEKNNAMLFASNVRQSIFSKLKSCDQKMFYITPHGFSDFKLLQKAHQINNRKKNNVCFDTTNIIMDDVIATLHLRTKTVTYLAERFANLDVRNNGFIYFDEFCNAFGKNSNAKEMRSLFDLFVEKGNGGGDDTNKIGFNQFLIGVSVCFMDDMIDDAIKIMFNGCANNCHLIAKKIVIDYYIANLDGNKMNNENFKKKSIKEFECFCDKVFGEKDKLTFDEFKNSITEHEMESMVHHFLQTIVLMKLKVKLKKEDFAISNEIQNKMYLNPLLALTRSSSIQSVKHQ